jgi:eukaryotic-like serine/threonine-protein kinase
VTSALTRGTPATLVLSLAGGTGAVNDVVFSADGKRLATASSDHTARVWDAATGAELLSLRGHTESVNGIAFSPDSAYLATANRDGAVRVWDLATGAKWWQGQAYAGHENEATAVAFSPECALSVGTGANPCLPRLAAVSELGAATVWDLATGERFLALPGFENKATSIQFSADGQHLATGGFYGTATVWEMATGREILHLSGHASAVTAIAFNPACANPFAPPALPDHSLAGVRGPCWTGLVTAGPDGLVRLRDTKSGLTRLTLLGHTKEVLGLSYTTDGTRLMTYGLDGTIRFYTLEFEELMALARARSTRTLTTGECRQYLHQPRCAWEPEPVEQP